MGPWSVENRSRGWQQTVVFAPQEDSSHLQADPVSAGLFGSVHGLIAKLVILPKY